MIVNIKCFVFLTRKGHVSGVLKKTKYTQNCKFLVNLHRVITLFL